MSATETTGAPTPRAARSAPSARLALRLGAPLLGAVTALSLLGFTPGLAAQAHGADQDAGHVYVLDNPAGPNTISTYNRSDTGALTYADTTSIGGVGTGNPLGSQGSLTLGDQRLFAVDGASNQISVVAIRHGELSLDGVYSSGGVLPVSLTYRDGLLYVANNGDTTTPANVVGFHVSEDGRLRPIARANVALSAALPAPAQVALSPDGATLAVTEKATNIVDTFRVSPNGALSRRESVASVGLTPFGFSFVPTSARELVVADAAGGAPGASAVTSYHVTAHGVVAKGAPVADDQTAACWLIITRNGAFAYTTNAGSGAISGYRVGHDGALSLLTAGGLTASTGVGSHPLEMTLSPSGDTLYALDAGTHTLSAFAIGANGGLTPISTAGISLGAGAVGLAAD